MGFLSRFLSFDKPMATTLTTLLYYLGIAAIAWHGVKRIWFWITYLDNDWDTALWGIIKTPFLMILALIVLRVIAEYVLAHFRMDKSLHDQVTGRAAPPASKAD